MPYGVKISGGRGFRSRPRHTYHRFSSHASFIFF